MPESARTFEGSCFCGKVRYRVAGPLGSMSHCHCTDCRKSHAAAFSTYIEAPRSAFRWMQGEGELQTYRAQSGTKRSFCRTCGSIVVCFVDDDPKTIEIAASTLDTPIDQRPEYHIFVRSKAAWHDIQDGLPQHEAYPKKQP